MKRWYFDIKRVSQKNDHGCGIACVATVCGLTYARARSEFFPDRIKFNDDESLHVDNNAMAKVIRSLGFTVVKSNTFLDSKRPAIVTFTWTPWNPRSNNVHGVVWDPWQKKIIDPGCDNFSDKHYIDTWERHPYQVLIITGKKKK